MANLWMLEELRRGGYGVSLAADPAQPGLVEAPVWVLVLTREGDSHSYVYRGSIDAVTQRAWEGTMPDESRGGRS